MAAPQRDSNIEAYLAPLQAQVYELREAVKMCVQILEGMRSPDVESPDLQRIKALLGA
jgi:hypothetical protein